MKFHTRHTFQTGRMKVHCKDPFLMRDFGICHDRIRTDVEVLSALPTPVR